MNCEEARQILLDSLVWLFPAERHTPMEDHIATCEACRQFLEVQRMLDARLTAAVPVVSLSPGFRSSLLEKLSDHTVPGWPEFLPDIAHLMGCALAITLLLLLMPQYSRTVLLAGSGFTAVTYFFQAILRSSLEPFEPEL
jgi:hypothetical protein